MAFVHSSLARMLNKLTTTDAKVDKMFHILQNKCPHKDTEEREDGEKHADDDPDDGSEEGDNGGGNNGNKNKEAQSHVGNAGRLNLNQLNITVNALASKNAKAAVAADDSAAKRTLESADTPTKESVAKSTKEAVAKSTKEAVASPAKPTESTLKESSRNGARQELSSEQLQWVVDQGVEKRKTLKIVNVCFEGCDFFLPSPSTSSSSVASFEVEPEPVFETALTVSAHVVPHQHCNCWEGCQEGWQWKKTTQVCRQRHHRGS